MTTLGAAAGFCTECGTQLQSTGQKFCHICGAALVQTQVNGGVQPSSTPPLNPSSEPAQAPDTRPNSELTYDELVARANAGDAEATKDVGIRHLRQGDQATANLWYEKAAAMGHSGAVRNLGVAAAAAGDAVRAEAYFLRSIEMGNTIAPANLLALLVEQGRDAEIQGWLDRLEELDCLLGYPRTAVAYLERGDDDQAISTLLQGAELGFGPAVEFLAIQLAQREQFDEAERWARIGFERSRQVTPAEAEEWASLMKAPAGVGSANILSVAAMFRGDLAEADRWLQHVPAEHRHQDVVAAGDTAEPQRGTSPRKKSLNIFG